MFWNIIASVMHWHSIKLRIHYTNVQFGREGKPRETATHGELLFSKIQEATSLLRTWDSNPEASRSNFHAPGTNGRSILVLRGIPWSTSKEATI